LLIVLFIEIGKHFIENKGDFFIKTEDMIKSGIVNYDNQIKELEFSENLYLNKIKREIRKILEKEEEDNNILIFKDATASGLQNYGILMGYREDKLKYLNIDGDE
jgi:type IV secretory pathway VirD2 relaxase